MVRITFVTADGRHSEQFHAEPGQTVLDVAQAHGVPIEGACEGSMVCSTCHVIVAAADYDRLPPPSVDEEDLLDLAYGLAPTSRLGCQIVLTDALDGLTVRLPGGTHNLLRD